MVKLKGELAPEITQPSENESYVISSAKEVDVEVKDKTFPAIRVLMKNTDEKDDKAYSVSLWLSDMPTPSSKLGCFIDAFQDFFKGSKDAYETDNWLGHTIKILSWKDKRRNIEVIA